MLSKWLPSWLRPESDSPASTELWPLSEPLFYLSKRDSFRIRHAVEGILVFGTTGSGKTSGSGRTIARSYLNAGMGGLVCCAKADEASLWESYARECGRSDDLIIVRPEGPWRFNFLDQELRRKTRGGGDTQVIVNMLMTIANIIKGDDSGGNQSDGGFWQSGSKLLLHKVIDLVALARGTITVADIYDVLNSAPRSVEQSRSADWQNNSACYQYLKHLYHRSKSDEQARDFQILENYWMGTFPDTAERTRSIFVATIMPLIDTLNRNPLRTLFCGETNFTMRDLEAGKIIVIDLPIAAFADVGKYAAGILKYSAQRSLETRDVIANPRPVFLWQDEYQHFALDGDALFQTTCRSYRVANVLLTQNISNLYWAMGGEKNKAIVDSLAGTLNTKIFHANSDNVTNLWMADHVGKSLQMVCNANISHPGGSAFGSAFGPGQANITSGVSEVFEYEIPPSRAMTLKTGGPANRFEVEAIVCMNGMCFHATGRPHLFCTFRQK